MTSRRAGAGAAVLTVLAVGLMLVMIMLAARSGPQRIIHGTLVDPSVRPVDPSYTFPTLPSHPHQGNATGPIHNDAVFRAVGVLILVAFWALVLWGVFWLLLKARKAVIERRRPPPEAVDFDVLDDPEPLAEEIRGDAVDQLALLLGGTARNAIVACWDRFEEQAERAHVARRDWETSSEFTLRLLDRVSADPVAVSRLEALYHEARFSSHEIGESRREEAVAALRAIHLSLGVGSVTG